MSGSALFLFGAPGNGKTAMAERIARVLSDPIYIPHALEVDGTIVKLFDPLVHHPVKVDSMLGVDQRWVRVERPLVTAGGELTLAGLDLLWSAGGRYYEAPLQLKANGGTLIIDDFGRQQMPAVQLLNRWIVALDGGVDHLTLHTGQTVEVPFDVLILFSTNLPPERLTDDAFIRRLRYKIELPNPTHDEFREIFRRECARSGVRYDDHALTYLLERWYDAADRDLRGCHPRDLIEAIVDGARYDDRPPELTEREIDDACETYFLRPLHAPA
jgi:predicted ATPase with chaperone activity